MNYAILMIIFLGFGSARASDFSYRDKPVKSCACLTSDHSATKGEYLCDVVYPGGIDHDYFKCAFKAEMGECVVRGLKGSEPKDAKCTLKKPTPPGHIATKKVSDVT